MIEERFCAYCGQPLRPVAIVANELSDEQKAELADALTREKRERDRVRVQTGVIGSGGNTVPDR